MPTSFSNQKALAEARNQLQALEIEQRPMNKDICYDWPTNHNNLPDLDDSFEWCIK